MAKLFLILIALDGIWKRLIKCSFKFKELRRKEGEVIFVIEFLIFKLQNELRSGNHSNSKLQLHARKILGKLSGLENGNHFAVVSQKAKHRTIMWKANYH